MGVLKIRILLFRVTTLGSPVFGNSQKPKKSSPGADALSQSSARALAVSLGFWVVFVGGFGGLGGFLVSLRVHVWVSGLGSFGGFLGLGLWVYGFRVSGFRGLGVLGGLLTPFDRV